MDKTKQLQIKQYLNRWDIPFDTDVSRYIVLKKLGQGTYGEVVKVMDKMTGDIAAMKSVKCITSDKQLRKSTRREMMMLATLRHKNVIRMLAVCYSEENEETEYVAKLHLILEYCEFVLFKIILNPRLPFYLGEIKKILQQIFRGLAYIHMNNVLHRDLKAANILLTSEGRVKIADFGLSREENKCSSYTNTVMTMYYKPPEILLGDKYYGRPADCWSLGCIMAEFWTRLPLFRGDSESSVLNAILEVCGSFTEEIWPKVNNLPAIMNGCILPADLPPMLRTKLDPIIGHKDACDLIEKLLTLDPVKRITAERALRHRFFRPDPSKVCLRQMLDYHTRSLKKDGTVGPRPAVYGDALVDLQFHKVVSMKRPLPS